MKKSLETIRGMVVDIGRLTFDNRYEILRDVAKTGRDVLALGGAWYLVSQAIDIPLYKPFIAHGGLVRICTWNGSFGTFSI